MGAAEAKEEAGQPREVQRREEKREICEMLVR